MDNKISIYVATHKPFALPRGADPEIFKPILCGGAYYDAAKQPKPAGRIVLPALTDNSGDNISAKNKNYAELTGLYQIQKNDNTSDIIGFNHYRRFFLDNDGYDIIDKDTILQDLEDYDFLVHGPGSEKEVQYSEDQSIYKGYAHDHRQRDLDLALDACKRLYPDLYEKFNYEVKNCTCLCMCNILLCKKEVFNEYCSFLFSILSDVESKIDLTEEFYNDSSQIRALGHLAERLQRAWLVTKGYKFKDQKICSYT